MEKKDLNKLKESLQKYKARALVATLGVTTAFNLGACAKSNLDSTESDTVKVTIESNSEEDIEKQNLFYNKDDLKLIAYFDQEGILRYRFGIITNLEQGEISADQMYTETFINFVTGDKSCIVIEKYDNLLNKEIVQNITNGVILDEIFTLPDSNLSNYYGIIDLNSIDLPGINNNLTIYSETVLKNIENILNNGTYDINNKRKEETYKVENLQAYWVNDEIIITDKSKSIFVSSIYNESYYVPSVTDSNKALKYMAQAKDLLYYEGDVREAYTLDCLTSANLEENQAYQEKNVNNFSVCNINEYLTDLQRLKKSLTYDEVVELKSVLYEAYATDLKR